MPISSFSVIPDVVHELQQAKRVLDIGIGNGMYGCLIRNYLPDSHITGIEGFAGYNNKMWACYDHIIIGIVPGVLDELVKGFDAIVMCDVIEHFDKEQGLIVVERLKALLHKGGKLIISTPSIFVHQGAVYGNDLEQHKSLWSAEELPGFVAVRSPECDKYGHYMNVFVFTK